ncbi:MAG TPA: DNA recombination protein RmuC [Flavitalea sp.]|nr:DNA recombination protein RmuC [Flavitalea sp.]
MHTLLIISVAFASGALIAFISNLLSRLRRLKAENDVFKDDNGSKQQIILNLIREKESRVSAEDLGNNYVPVRAHNLVTYELEEARSKLSEKDKQLLELTKALTALKKDEEAVNEKLSTFKEELDRLHKLSKEEFRNLAGDILEEKKKLFVETNRSELGNIINPLKNDLDIFKKAVEETRKEDIREFTSLKDEIHSLQQLNTQLSDDARNLAKALKSDTKVQGSWGEDRLLFILESEGLQPYIDFTLQETIRDVDNDINRRPDCILKLPGNKHLVIDSKVSLTAYVNYCNSSLPEERAKYLKLHLKSITDHIDFLADKQYHALQGLQTPDYVFLFMPIESAITLALNENEDIFNRALNKKVVLITPTTLVATLKVIKIIWQKENQVKNVELIFKQCGALYDKFVMFLEEMEKVGSGLQTANRSYNEAMDRLKDGARKGDTIIGRFEAIKKLEAKTNKSIPKKYIDELEIISDDKETPVITLIDVPAEHGAAK